MAHVGNTEKKRDFVQTVFGLYSAQKPNFRWYEFVQRFATEAADTWEDACAIVRFLYSGFTREEVLHAIKMCTSHQPIKFVALQSLKMGDEVVLGLGAAGTSVKIQIPNDISKDATVFLMISRDRIQQARGATQASRGQLPIARQKRRQEEALDRVAAALGLVALQGAKRCKSGV